MASIAQTTGKTQGGEQSPGIQEGQHAVVKSATQRNLEYGFYVQCSEVVLQSKLLSFQAKCVYEQLLCHAREKETCYPGHTTLARELGKSVDTIQRGLRELHDVGLITWKRRGLTKTNLYTIVEFSEVPGLKNFLPEPRPQKSGNQKLQECGLLKPQNCGTNQNQSKNIQVESIKGRFFEAWMKR